MPSKHKVEVIEKVAPDLDPTLTGTLGSSELSTIMYMLSRVKVDVKLTDLRVEYYDEVTAALSKASCRFKDKNPPEFRAMIDALTCLLSDTSLGLGERWDRLMVMGCEHGFLPQWLQDKKKPQVNIMDFMKHIREKKQRLETAQTSSEHALPAPGPLPQSAGRPPTNSIQHQAAPRTPAEATPQLPQRELPQYRFFLGQAVQGQCHHQP
jgi:hypothetical protein